MSRRSHHPARRHTRPPHAEARTELRTELRTPPLGRAEEIQPDASDVRIEEPVAADAATEMPSAVSEPTEVSSAVAPNVAPATASGPDAESLVERAPAVDQERSANLNSNPDAIAAASPPRPSGSPRTGPLAEPDRTGCTAPQLRRFIKSRTYVPMHELRRRFAIVGDDDEVTPVDLQSNGRVFVGLPNREGRLLGELFRAGDVGYELSLDPISPIVVGVFPMRPVPRA